MNATILNPDEEKAVLSVKLEKLRAQIHPIAERLRKRISLQHLTVNEICAAANRIDTRFNNALSAVMYATQREFKDFEAQELNRFDLEQNIAPRAGERSLAHCGFSCYTLVGILRAFGLLAEFMNPEKHHIWAEDSSAIRALGEMLEASADELEAFEREK